MIRLSESQFALFQAGQKAAAKRTKKQVAAQPENLLESQIRPFLALRGWRVIRLLAGTFKSIDGRRFVRGADTGTPDWLCVRGEQAFFLETKAPLGKLRPAQEIWIAQARREGMEVRVSSDFYKFVAWYRERWET